MKQRWIGLIFCVVLIFGLVPAAGAQMKTTYHTFQLLYWSASASGGGSSWTTGFWDLEYGMIRVDSPWGYHLHYLTGSQSGGPGGTDTFWNIEASYALSGMRGLPARAFLGYGSYGWTAPGAPGAVTSTGFRVGFDVEQALTVAPGGGFTLHYGFNWSPSNSSRSSTGTSSGAVTDWSISLVYKFPSRMAAAQGIDEIVYTPNSLILQPRWRNPPSTDWSAELGVRGVSADAGSAASVYNWSGLFFGFAKTF